MCAKNRPKKHHYLPCMLLSRFGEGDGRKAQVWMWDKKTGAVRRVRVEDVGFQKNLYRLPSEVLEKLTDEDRETLPEGWDDEVAFERMFGFVENDLAKILDLMNESKTVPPEGTPALDNLIVALVLFDLRTPAKMEEARVLTETTVNLIAKDMMDLDPSWQGKTFSPVSVPFKTNSHKLLGLALAAGYEPLVTLMRERKWSMMVAACGDFAIADHPVNITFARPHDGEFTHAAPAVPETIVMFPVADDTLVVGEFEMSSGVYEADERWVGYQNTVALGNAERYLFTRKDSFPMLTDGKNLPAYEAVYESDEQVFTMTPELFAKAVKDGRIRSPRRIFINGVPADVLLARMNGMRIGEGDEPGEPPGGGERG